LQHSAVPEARFQAAVALRESALESWSALPDSQRIELRTWTLQHGVALAAAQMADAGSGGRCGGIDAAIANTLLATHAVFLKRAWGDVAQGDGKAEVVRVRSRPSSGASL
jgi:hypothetical protein